MTFRKKKYIIGYPIGGRPRLDRPQKDNKRQVRPITCDDDCLYVLYGNIIEQAIRSYIVYDKLNREHAEAKLYLFSGKIKDLLDMDVDYLIRGWIDSHLGLIARVITFNIKKYTTAKKHDAGWKHAKSYLFDNKELYDYLGIDIKEEIDNWITSHPAAIRKAEEERRKEDGGNSEEKQIKKRGRSKAKSIRNFEKSLSVGL